jgi:hypothetical protein
MRILLFFLACVPFFASATLFSELPPTRTGSIDEIFDSCFADAECSARIQPLVAKLSNRFGSDLDELLHNCLNNVRSMSVCGAFRAEVLASELTDLESSIANSRGASCAKHLIARAKRDVRAKIRECYRQADSLGEGADKRMSRDSCGADEDQSVLTIMRHLNPLKVCGRGG